MPPEQSADGCRLELIRTPTASDSAVRSSAAPSAKLARVGTGFHAARTCVAASLAMTKREPGGTEVMPTKAERPASRSPRCGNSSEAASHPVSGWAFVKAASARALDPHTTPPTVSLR
jgi:hypothetical protein